MSRYTIDFSLKNGLGKPSVNLYLTGCDKPDKCKGCHNWEMQDPDFSNFDFQKLLNAIKVNIETSKIFHKDSYFCVLGGEPLASFNKQITMDVAKFVKNTFPDTTLIVYSWHEPQELEYFDYGVLGPYEEELYKENILPSSSNQYIYDFKNKTRLKDIKLKQGTNA